MWHFRKMGRAEMNEDPTAGDFFNVDALKDMADALVREAIQNSLDAKIEGTDEPVLVQISLPGSSASLPPSDSKTFFKGIWRHISATNVLETPPEQSDSVQWLSVEDFGTRGLEGDPTASDDPKPGDTNDFYYFWRNVGRGKKEGNERGRWGLGKTMFPASSQMHTFFGLTVRANDGRKLLMGQSVLTIHRIDNEKHYPYGYFGQLDGTDGFVLPIDDPRETADFAKSFRLRRGDSPGLSVVVPFPARTITAEGIQHSVIEHYFFPIIAGELQVEVFDGTEMRIIDASTIDEVASTLLAPEDQDFFGTLELAKHFLSRSDSEIFVAKSQQSTKSPHWDESLFSGEALETMAEKLDEGEPVIAKIPVYVCRKGCLPVENFFYIALCRDRNLDRPKDVYVRQGITISGVKSLHEAGVRALVIAQDGELATFLGDSENPAHTEWQSRSRKFKGKYNRGRSTLDFVKDAPHQFMRILNKRSEAIDDTALRHIFPDKSGAGRPTANEPIKPDPNPTRTRKPRLDIERRKKAFSMSQTSSGFTVNLTDDGANDLPLCLSLRCAYDTARHNPFKRWSSADFDFAEHDSLEMTGGEWLEKHDNRLKVTATDADFSLRAHDFDADRDLIVDVRLERNPDA